MRFHLAEGIDGNHRGLSQKDFSSGVDGGGNGFFNSYADEKIPTAVIPAQAGIHCPMLGKRCFIKVCLNLLLDSRLRGNDGILFITLIFSRKI
uniref:Uncharacterized protein n=1 Tax=Conchiformibius kuhniae TaxID=211502 RepID=A0A8T9MZX7_9NEIS|nr:hypothetical protein LVJ77_11245 [Conchiformibius kuhniae]